MKILDQGIIIAPGSLHLAVYDEIFKEKGNCLNLSALTLNSFLLSHLKTKAPTPLELIFQYAKALKDLPETNAFYGSAGDYDFLEACLKFMQTAALYNLQEFPQDTRKEKDLYEIIQRLKPITLWQEKLRDIQFENPASLQLLKTEYSPSTQYFISRLKEQGAVELKNEPSKQRIYYWSASNIRKEIEACAQAIISQDLKAEDVFVALSDPKDQMVLAQIFNARNIPFTFLHPQMTSPVIRQFQAALTYAAEPSEDHLRQALKALYPRQSETLLEYLSEMDPETSILDLTYEPNAVISEEEFADLQSLERQAVSWRPYLDEMAAWDYTSFEAIAAIIQEQNPNPTDDDLAAFDAAGSAYISVMDQIQSRDDLKLFIRHLSRVHPNHSLTAMKGVLVGDRSEMSCLRKTSFLIGADASTFPAFTMHTGIFDEAYMSRLKGYPSLAERLDAQRANLFEMLEMPNSLIIETAQSDYEGNAIQSSHELNTWLNQLPKFQNPREASVLTKPDFSLSSQLSSRLYARDQRVDMKAASLSVYENCPFQHLLKYGIRLHSRFRLEERMDVNAEILVRILQNALIKYKKPFFMLTGEQIRSLTDDEFHFVSLVFPKKAHLIAVLKKEYETKIQQILDLLAPIETDWNMALSPGDYQLSMEEELDGLHVSITGALNKKGNHRTSFNLYEKDDSLMTPDAPVKGTIDLNLNISPVAQEAFKISYGRGSLPANASHCDEAFSEEQFQKDFLKKSFVAQDLSESSIPEKEYVRTKVDTYEKKTQALKTAAQSFISSLQEDCVLPSHKPGACQYCSYKSICRNGSVERG